MALVTVLYQFQQLPPTGGNLTCRMVTDDANLSLLIPPQPQNGALTGEPDIPITMPSTSDKTRGWARPRGVMLGWLEKAPEGYSDDGRIFVPIFRRSRFDRIHVGQVGTYRELSVIVVSKLPEYLRN